MTEVDGFEVAPERVRPWYSRVLRAHLSLIEVGKSPTLVNLSRELGITRQAVHGMFHRHPDLLAWIDRHVSAANAHYTGLVMRRVLNLAIQGSPQHAEMFLKHQAGGYRPNGATGEPGTPNGPTFVIHSLIPRPPDLPVTETMPSALPSANIPVVEVR